MKVVYDMIIDFAFPSKSNTLLVMQDDHLSRVCHFILKSNGRDMDVSDVATYSVKAVLSDSTVVYDSGAMDADSDGVQMNEITYAIPQALTEVIGKTTLTVSLTGDDGSVLHSFEVYVRSRNELLAEDDDSTDDMAGFRDILNRAADAIEKIEALSSKSVLPNPYALRLHFGDKVVSYDGSVTVTANFTNVAYIDDEYSEEAVAIVWGNSDGN